MDADNPELRLFCEFIFQKLKNYSKQSVNLIQQEILQILFRFDGVTFFPTNYQETSHMSSSTAHVLRGGHQEEGYQMRTLTPLTIASHCPNYSNYQHRATTSPMAPLSVTTSTQCETPYSYSHTSLSPQSIYSENLEDLV